MKILFSLAISVVLCGGLYIALKFMKAKQIQRENKMLNAYMESLQSFCDEIQKRIEAIRKYRHDLKGYIQTLEALVGAENENETVRQYLEEQNKKHSQLKTFEFCSDEFINTVIGLKQEECMKNGIPVNFNINDGDYSGIEEIDKVCLIINLLDNAIEATQRLYLNEMHEIKMEMRSDGDSVTIYIENALAKNEKFSFITTKADKHNHGLGTAIIKQVIDKYNGTRNTVIDKENCILKDEICLACRQEVKAV